ncbi:MAG: MFS transporter [Bacillota bacterium]
MHLERHMAALLIFNFWNALMLLMFRPLVPLYLDCLGIEPFTMGVVLSAYSLVPAVISLWVSWIVSRLTLRRWSYLLIVLTFSGCMLFYLSGNIGILFAGQLLVGLAQILLVLGSQSYISCSCSDKSLTWGFSLLVASYGAAGIIGPTVGGFLAQQFDYRQAFLVIGVSSIVGVFFSGLLAREYITKTKRVPIDRLHVHHIFESGRYKLSLMLTVAALCILTLFNSFFPLYLRQMGLEPFSIGFLLSLRGVGELLAPPLLRALERKLRRARLLQATLVAEIGLVAMMPLLQSALLLGVGSAMVGGAFGILTAMSLALATEDTERETRAMALGLRFTFNRITDTLGPIVFGAAAVVWGYAAPFYVVVFYLVLALVSVKVHFRASKLSGEAGTG